MFGLWDVPDVGCSRYGMFRLWDVRDMQYSGCGMFGMWDVRDVGFSRCGMFGMWDLGCLPGCGMLIYKMLSCDKDEAHGFEVQALCCSIMNTLSITHLTITFKTAQEYEHITALLAGHWQVANSILPIDF